MRPKTSITFEGTDEPAGVVKLEPIRRILLKPTEAAMSLGISARTLWALTKDGTIPSTKLGKLTRYSPAALEEWVQKRIKEAAA